MSEPDKQQFGDGGDQWGEAARNVVNAAKELGKEGVKSAASGTTAGVANSSAALVKAGVEGGKAVSEIAAGTAAGGPWGAVLSTAWSLRHTLYKILVCICLFFLILIVLLTSLPTIVTNQVFGLNGCLLYTSCLLGLVLPAVLPAAGGSHLHLPVVGAGGGAG